MIGERVALLAGLFAVPVLLLWLGHRLRDRTARQQGAFWGGVTGHAVGLTVTLVAAVKPAVWWAGGPFLRDFAVHWTPMLLAIGGLAIGALLSRRTG